MGKQTESVWVANPMSLHLRAMGWTVFNITPGFVNIGRARIPTMSGWPDAYICKQGYLPRWVEFKVIRKGKISFKDTQINHFPKMMNAGCSLYIICSDKPLKNDEYERNRLYKKILGAPNGDLMRNKNTHRMLY